MYETYPPPAELSRYVECFWHWKSESSSQENQLILPDAAPELIVHLGTVPSAWSKATGWQDQPQAFIYCAARRCLDLRVPASMDVFAVRFRPWGLSRFNLGKMSEMLDRAVSPAQGLEDLGPRVVKAVESEGTDETRRGRVNELLLSELEIDSPRAGLISALIDALNGAENPAQRLAAQLSRSSRTVRRLWRELVGISPRSYAKLMRFHRALAFVEQGQPLVAVAAECGYADQAHMGRQIRQLSGLPPSRLKTWLGLHVYQDLYADRPEAPWKLWGQSRGTE